MRFLTALSLASIFSWGATYPTPLDQRDTKKPIRFDFNVLRSILDDIPEEILKAEQKILQALFKEKGYPLTLDNDYALYVADFKIGTPSQSVRVQIDTGSSDFFVPASNTTSSYGTFDPEKSLTFKQKNESFSISYGDGSYANGQFATDDFTFSDIVLSDVIFSAATDQTTGEGICGLGFKGNEASVYSSSSHKSYEYDNLPVQLKKQGYINKRAYSLYLNQENAKTGSLLFGAIDHAKYEGDLKILDIVNIDDSGDATDEPVAFFVNLDSITTNDTSFNNKSYPALLDSGTTLLYAPTKIYEALGSKYGNYNGIYGGYTTSCDTTDPDFKFGFQDKTITVPFKNFLYSLKKDGSTQNPNLCLFGFQDAGTDMYILGDNFLRSAYVYYDLDDAKVGLAQAVYTTEENIEYV